MLGLLQVAGAHEDLQQMVAACAALDLLLARNQIAGHEGEQVAGLSVRVGPLGEVAAVFQRALLDQVAVGQQHRVRGLVGAQRHGIHGHHVGTVQEIGDAAETLGLALGEERALAHIQAHELGVLGGRAGGEDFQIDGVAALGQVLQHELVAVHLERGAAAVDQHARKVQFIAVQAQRLRRHLGVAAHAHLVEHAGLGRIEIEGQVHGVDPPGRSLVVGAVDGGGRGLPVTQLQHTDSFLCQYQGTEFKPLCGRCRPGA